MVKKLTLEDRRKIEQMWKDNASPLKTAACGRGTCGYSATKWT